MKSKYCLIEHPATTSNLKNASNIWKYMLAIRSLAESHIKWLVGKGEIGVTKDQWYYSNILSYPEAVQLKSFFNMDGSPKDQLINNYPGSEVLVEIHSKGILISEEHDACYWDQSATGTFSLSSAWHLVRQRNPSTLISKHCWHKHIPLKISPFMWKLIYSQGSSKKGILLPSKCHCCYTSPSIEFNNHIFLSSDVAKQVWGFFNDLLDINGECLTVNYMLSTWWQHAKGNGLSSWIYKILPSVIIWHIWKAQCKAKFEDSEMHHLDIIAPIKEQILQIYSSFKVQLLKGNIPSEALSFFEITPSENVGLFTWSNGCLQLWDGLN